MTRRRVCLVMFQAMADMTSKKLRFDPTEGPLDDVSAVAIFCQDIREEKAGTVSIVGILPDNISSD